MKAWGSPRETPAFHEWGLTRPSVFCSPPHYPGPWLSCWRHPLSWTWKTEIFFGLVPRSAFKGRASEVGCQLQAAGSMLFPRCIWEPHKKCWWLTSTEENTPEMHTQMWSGKSILPLWLGVSMSHLADWITWEFVTYLFDKLREKGSDFLATFWGSHPVKGCFLSGFWWELEICLCSVCLKCFGFGKL